MEIDGPTFVPKSDYFFFTNLGQRLSQEVACSKFFSQFCEVDFRQNVGSSRALSNKKSTFVLISGFLAVVFLQFCPNNI